MKSLIRNGKRVLVGIVGGFVVIIGFIMIPYPGPGWLIVFAGLSILAVEFHWARRLLAFAKGKYQTWQACLKSQPKSTQVLVWLTTVIIVLATIWLANGYGLVDRWFNLGQAWMHSPILRLFSS